MKLWIDKPLKKEIALRTSKGGMAYLSWKAYRLNLWWFSINLEFHTTEWIY